MKKVVSIALSLVMCLGLLASCGSSSASSTATSGSGTEAESTGDVTLTYWYWADNDEYAKTMDEMVADFNATNGKRHHCGCRAAALGWRRIQHQPAECCDRWRRP